MLASPLTAFGLATCLPAATIEQSKEAQLVFESIECHMAAWLTVSCGLAVLLSSGQQASAAALCASASRLAISHQPLCGRCLYLGQVELCCWA